MIVQFEGREWQWDPETDITTKEAAVLRKAFGFSVKEWMSGLKEIDDRSWTFTYWLLRKRNGVTGPDGQPELIDDLDFPMLTFVSAYSAGAKASNEGLEDLPEEDPKSLHSPPEDLPSPPPTPMAMTPPPPQPSAPPWAGTAYTRPMSPTYAAPTSSISATSATYPPPPSTP